MSKYEITSNVKISKYHMSDAARLLISRIRRAITNLIILMSNVKHFTSNVKMWKCHMSHAARLLISVGRRIRRTSRIL